MAKDTKTSLDSASVASVAPVANESLKVDKEHSQPTDQQEKQDNVVVTNTPESSTILQTEDAPDDGDVWERVEVKPRSNRRKTVDRSNTMSSRSSGGTGSGATDNGGSRKSKEKRTAATRRKNATRKMVREILSGVLDSVDTETRRPKVVAAPSSSAAPSNSENCWKKGPPNRVANDQTGVVEGTPNRQKSLRDVVLGNHVAASGGGVSAPSASAQTSDSLKKDHGDKPEGYVVHESSKARQATSDASNRRSTASASSNKSLSNKQTSKETEPSTDSQKKPLSDSAAKFKPITKETSLTKQNSSKWNKGKAASPADQNTAPTYQETVSAMSSASNRLSDRATTKNDAVEPSSKSDSSSGGVEEAPQKRDGAAIPAEKGALPAPPLVTLVSPENATSATSSVASSLEVPHTSRRHHRSNSTPDAAGVGYHLLDVCDRLSRDMNLFMSSREQAANIRRRERVEVLAALQDSLSGLWPGMCRVETYGSCATGLDLPSSDLDVVVVGLDHSEMVIANQMAAAQQHAKRPRRRSHSTDASVGDENGRSGHVMNPPLSPRVSHGGFVPLSLYRNSERVKQLALKIEGQPWAVKVKSLPNASVPVIKILADPSKLAGSIFSGEWPSPMPDTLNSQKEQQSNNVPGDGSTSSNQHAPSQNLYEPWRGSDVMNGLISLDITFEGPEHGGLGSTDYSLRVVHEACQEAGFGSSPETTAFVQCLMVLKELLVQRKLNEPYSGGLSSYALLLLLWGLVHERSLIRQEIEGVERQRQAMAQGDVATYANALTGDVSVDHAPQVIQSDAMNNAMFSSGKRKDSEGAQDPEASRADAPSKIPAAASSSAPLKPVSSWASIAKKPNPTPTPSISGDPVGSKKGTEAVVEKQKTNRPASFADALARTTVNSKAKAPVGEESVAIEAPKNESKNVIDDRAAQSAWKEAAPPSPSRSGDKSTADNKLGMPSVYPQGFDDVIEVLCTGETTAGKLLMHFLLYYGQYFDAQGTAIDVSGTHERVFPGQPYSPYSYHSPYIPRRAAETIDPITGMLVIDHIVIYDPLEGAEHNNVARRCFAWQQVKWIFAQSYATLSSAVERSATPPSTPGGRPPMSEVADKVAPVDPQTGDLMDPSLSLLRCLLSF